MSSGGAKPRPAGNKKGVQVSLQQGCQMVCFQTKSTNLGKFWRALDWKMFIYFMAIWNILWTFGIFFDHLVHFVFIWYIFPVWVSCTNKNLATLVFNPEATWANTTIVSYVQCHRCKKLTAQSLVCFLPKQNSFIFLEETAKLCTTSIDPYIHM
jgi:hypothetical protein